MPEITPRLVLECKKCDYRPNPESTMEVFALHYQVEHDSDDYAMNLSAVCTCGATMEHTVSTPTGGGFFDHVVCNACGNTGRIKRNG